MATPPWCESLFLLRRIKTLHFGVLWDGIDDPSHKTLHFGVLWEGNAGATEQGASYGPPPLYTVGCEGSLNQTSGPAVG